MSLSVNAPVPSNPAWYIIHARDMEKIRAVIVRLYSDRRFTGDEMRDTAQTLNSAFDAAFHDEAPCTPSAPERLRMTCEYKNGCNGMKCEAPTMTKAWCRFCERTVDL